MMRKERDKIKLFMNINKLKGMCDPNQGIDNMCAILYILIYIGIFTQMSKQYISSLFAY